MYTNIPTDELLTIIESACNNNNEVEKDLKRDILKLLKVIIEQNYFQFSIIRYYIGFHIVTITTM